MPEVLTALAPSELAVPVLLGCIVGLWALLLRQRRAHRAATAHAARLARFLTALSRTNRMVLRTEDERSVFTETCRICVETGHALLACIYVHDDGFLRRAATAGPAAEVLAQVPDPWDIRGTDAQATYTVRALHEGRPQVSNQYQHDPMAGRWRSEAVARGIHAIAWMPLRRGGTVRGVLMLCADAPDFFDAPLLELLGEMGDDISYALDNIDREAERRAAAREIEAGRDRFERLFQSAPVPSAIVSLSDRRIVDVNEATCSRYGLAGDAMRGATTASFAQGVMPEDRELFYRRLREDGRVRNLVVRVRDQGGTVHPEVLNADPIDYLGQPCCLVTSLDISDLRVAAETRRALAEAQAANQAKTEFLSRISHELRTPLHAILGFAALLRRDAGARLAPADLEHVAHLERAGWHLLALVDDVLDLSRAEIGRIDVKPQPLALAPVLQETLALQQPLAERQQVALQLALPGEDAAAVRADRTRLRQVLINLLSNAVKYNRPGGEVRVTCQRRGALIEIEVADNGLGMTPEQQARLFEPFNRLGREREGIEGTGIGLALARQLATLMDGELAIDSAPERGTRAWLRLPACTMPVVPPARPTADDAAPAEATVLCIEDNPVSALLVEQLLARTPGVRVVTASTGNEGLARAAAAPPDLVLLDLQLPDLGGLEVLQRLRADPSTTSTPVIVLSAGALDEEVAAARQAGATDYWTKPLDYQRFPADVLRQLARRAPTAEAAAPR